MNTSLVRTERNALPVILILLVAALVTVRQTLPPAPLPAGAPAADFSAERAVEHIRILAQSPRPTGSPANTAARNYILETLQNLGLEVETQPGGGLVNVLGRITGTRSSGAVLLTAHLDSVAESPGATDDGSGVAVLLETARALVSGAPMPNTVMFLFTDFEEGGTVGAEKFITGHPWAQDVRVVVGFDAGGLSGPAVLSATSAENGWLIRQAAQADASLVGSSAINAFAESGTDFGQRFKPAGFSGYAFDLYWDRRIHTPEDSLENISLSSIQHQGLHALSLARHFGNLDVMVDPRDGDAIYFSLLRLLMVTYSSGWAIPLAVLVAAVFLGVLAFGLRQGILSWGGMGYGTLIVLAGLILAPVPGILLQLREPGIPIRYVGRSLAQPPQVILVVLIALILIGLWYALARKLKHIRLPDLGVGALFPMLAGMLGTALVFPALSFVFTWPLLLSLLSVANLSFWQARHKVSKTAVFGFLLSGVAGIIILGPTIVLGLFDQMPLTLLLLGVLCGFLLPLTAVKDKLN